MNSVKMTGKINLLKKDSNKFDLIKEDFLFKTNDTENPQEEIFNYYKKILEGKENVLKLDCSNHIKEIISILLLEKKELEKANENYKYKYTKKRESKRESISKFSKEIKDNISTINILKEIVSNIFHYKNLNQMVLIKNLINN